ncbi:hypothetical protein L1987_34809 [Smallanthus sonchifolius]|uniref:Uncharacterized protein n=1 Tax=Smallanthus sonchifolius TaxID=185202 RepID=A0ACB9HWA3_9ASTR|nr:hypothetical protein L1987_34809 [Smallanthus sonchifolius]
MGKEQDPQKLKKIAASCLRLCGSPIGPQLGFYCAGSTCTCENRCCRFAVDHSLVGCGRLQKSGACYSPDNAINHVSIAMNLYFQSRGRNTCNCDFKNSGLLSVSGPTGRNRGPK